MTSKFHLHVAAYIPPHLTRESIIAALHDHNTCLSLQALTTGHTKLPDTHPETKKDTYWYPVDLHDVTTYSVSETVTLVPGIGDWGKRYLTFPSCFQNTPHGVKTRADAPGGVVLRAEFRVIPGGADEGEVDGEGEGVGDAEWVLVEDVEVQCAWYLMPFVRRGMEDGHRDICRKVIEKVEMSRRQEEMARRVERGKMRAEEEMRGPGSVTGGFDDDEEEERKGEAERLPDKITYG
ncbi:hypothetical protein EJ04DRAFT_513622 [Polyplosphaeria fusca]|uniref:DUF7053 domain-containing protein n=1 Tax=Polyplosphaeria fusca TaxID=682080 RepID=A0A9P4QUV3_9PLEO|nr:hypothetical protein EJ04DRAFT_513622 [Polyplosphaeria fusca]